MKEKKAKKGKDKGAAKKLSRQEKRFALNVLEKKAADGVKRIAKGGEKLPQTIKR